MIKTLSFILLKEFYHYYFKTLTIQLLFLMKYHKIIDKTLANVIDDLFEDPEIIDEQTCRWCKKTYFNKDIPDNFKVLKHIPRCSATNLKVNSDQADINLPNELKKVYGHMDMGIYLYPLNNGKISVHDELIVN